MSSALAGAIAAVRASLQDRLFPRPVETVDGLAQFVGSRSAYVAQTALFGYLKTRMGTKFPRYFEDLEFSAEIRAAALKICASCAADFTLYAVAVTGDAGRLDPASAAALARRCYELALAAAEAGPADPARLRAFGERADRTIWANAPKGMAVFEGSAADVIRFAPVTAEFKALDDRIVRNSIRFRWVAARDQLTRRLRPEAVCADWSARRGA